jgi:glyoxylase-like metal-dependent hydrolase (beta-lactamase superfamily II)
MGKAGTYNVAILDFPEGNFVQRDNTGAVSGSLVTAAIEEIVSEIEGIPAGFIYDVQMVYSHQHFDHIGAATITYDYIMNNWKPTGEVQIIADESVHEEFTERAEAGFFSFRAPFPDHLITEDTTEIPLTKDVGYSVTQTGGHTSGKDLIIFVERKGDSPPIMMVVDVVFPGWAPFFDFAIATDVFQYLKVSVPRWLLCYLEFDCSDLFLPCVLSAECNFPFLI